MIRAADILGQAGVLAAAEPQTIQSDDYRFLYVSAPRGYEGWMRKVYLFASQKRLVPIYRSTVTAKRRGGLFGDIADSYAVLFRSTQEQRRNFATLSAIAKKLMAPEAVVLVFDPRAAAQQYVPTRTVMPGSEIWKYLVRYGFVTEKAEAAAELQRNQRDTIASFGALHGKFAAAAAEPLVFSRLHALLDNQADATDDGRYKLLLADMHMYMLYVDLKAHTYQIRIEGGREGTEVDGPVLKLPATDAAAVALIKKIQAEFKAAEANVSRLYQEVNDAVDNYSTTMEALLAKYKLPARPVPYIDAEDAGFVYLQVVRA